MAIAAAIPWKMILEALPAMVVTARQLWKHWSSRPQPAPIDPAADAKTQLVSLAERLATLEGAEAEQARLMSQIAEQLQGIAHRASIAYWLGLSALLLSCFVLLLMILL